MVIRRLAPAIVATTAIAVIAVAITSWYRWEPAAILTAVLFLAAALTHDPEAPNDGQHP